MKSLILSGYALCWDEKAFIVKEWDNRFFEQFQRGAFSETIKKGNQKLLLFHKRHYEIPKANIIFLEDEKGLAFRINLPNNNDGRFAYNLVQGCDLNHVSISFRNAKGEVDKYRHFPFHIIKRADLEEISLVTYPAYKTSSVRTGCNHKELNLISKINNALKQ